MQPPESSFSVALLVVSAIMLATTAIAAFWMLPLPHAVIGFIPVVAFSRYAAGNTWAESVVLSAIIVGLVALLKSSI